MDKVAYTQIIRNFRTVYPKFDVSVYLKNFSYKSIANWKYIANIL